MQQRKSLFDAITTMADGIERSKQANVGIVKKSEGPVPKDPGGYTGPSTHPTATASNNCQTAVEGARSSENEADVKKDQGPPSVNNASDAKPGQQDSVQLNIGTTQSATGEDPSVEDDFKGGYEDPGSTHDARTDNTALDGAKYANLSFSDAYNLQSRLANAMLADIVNGQKVQTKSAGADAGNLNPSEASTPSSVLKPRVQSSDENPGANPPGGSISDMVTKAAAALTPSANQDLAAGYELATAIGMDKAAAQKFVAETIENVISDASLDADLFGAYFNQERAKYAADAEAATAGEDHDKSGDGSSGANQADGEGGGGGGSDPSAKSDSADVLAMLGDSGEPSGMAGGSAGETGGDPSGAPVGGPPGGAPGGHSEEELLTQIISALNELGIPIDQLSQLGAGGPPGAGGGMPPGAGGPPGGGMPPADAGMKIASAAKSYMQSGRFRYVTANDGTAARKLRDQMKTFLREHLR